MNLLNRKIDWQVSEAITNFDNLKTSNTTVEVINDKIIVWLHGNAIATVNLDHHETNTRIVFDTCGWHTQTTKARLNAVVHALHRLNYALEVKGFKIKNGIIYAVLRDELVSLANARFVCDQ